MLCWLDPLSPNPVAGENLELLLGDGPVSALGPKLDLLELSLPRLDIVASKCEEIHQLALTQAARVLDTEEASLEKLHAKNQEQVSAIEGINSRLASSLERHEALNQQALAAMRKWDLELTSWQLQ